MKNMKTFKITWLPAAILLISVILASCGSAGLTAPTGLLAADADPDNPNRVQISWLPVDGADIYYVYRDTAADGSFSTNAGFSVTSAEDGEGVLRYNFMETFDEGAGGTYYYKVTSDILDGLSIESAMSAAVAASTYSGTWSSADTSIIGTAEQLSLSAGITSLYAVYGSTTLSAKEYAEDADSEEDDPPGSWTSLAGTIGSVSAAVDTAPEFSTLVSGGELYVAFADDNEADKVSMRYYHDSSTGDEDEAFAWTAAGDAGFNDAAASNIATATVGFGGDIYSAFLNDTGGDPEADEISLFKYNSTTDSWFESDISADVPEDAFNVSLVSHSNSLYIGYEDTANTDLFLRSYDDGVTALAAGGLVTGMDIDDGNAVFVSGGGDLYALYITAAGLSVKKLVDAAWTDLDDVAGDTPPVSTAAVSDYGTLAAHWFNGYLYVFYVDSDGKGWVKYYDEDDGWQNAESGGLALTSGTTGLGSFQLASVGTELYAGYIEDGSAYVRILK